MECTAYNFRFSNSPIRSIYSNDIVKLTLEIADPNVLQVKKDIAMSFSGQLGVIGESQICIEKVVLSGF